ncbi:Zn-dependent hydrolase [Verminephrobacter aporrectodeae subsp. tuberculatae]|uniref:Zn-dependent hydrolase n=1 Tax=Verminephrobacter aporrectodeae TaxID=1110389 RepID=UPI0022446EF3|nr:Zn-dependent hydrolase [Verminephrobacter aporrectodeae]MCW8163564.1 Zn-dependent hydrolase [Verminephrobacter aporrectodeae subsp. tuberculatae]MCW8167715.1 Zn-dependent hydrolase [Verminephrobacter aporrectodeae subsp. tuberculatae]MCW8205696.1 Zn-dependent hydrolase [Verminephrobacter aporrectodeae subsp. tuberculatae]
MQAIQVNRARLKQAMETISAVGATPRGGLHRLALGDADKQARDLLCAWCTQAGYPVRVDRIGSMYARRAGRSEGDPPVLIGSHLDSQPMAGRFDGAVGVVAALEVMRTLDDHGIATHLPIDLVNWTNEEGARFQPPLLASGVFAGAHALEYALSRQDSAGLSVASELERIGYAGAHAAGFPISSYIELHIEQGVVLEQARATIGVVSGFVGIRDTRVSVLGENVHAGPLPMQLRRDALVGAAQMVLAAQEVGLAQSPDARVTVGRLSVPSDSHSIVPGRVDLVLDLRHPDAASLDALQAQLQERFAQIATRLGLSVQFEPYWNYVPIVFAPTLREHIRAAARMHGYPCLDLPSRAGHDALNIARVAPTAMIFIPCLKGISHNESEYASDEDIAAGADVLLAATLAAATQ